MLKEILLKKSQMRSQVNNAVIQLGDTDDSGKGKKFKSRFIQAGIAGYPESFGNVLIKKETLDKYVNTMVGVPVIINHKDITVDNADGLRVGVVSDVWFDEKDGWYWCNGVIWDETAQELIKEKGWSVSCSYDALEGDNEGGSENNIKYDREFTKMNFTHLALVSNPRYERANIVFNSKTIIVDNADKEFVTVGVGEGQHVIPVDYMKKKSNVNVAKSDIEKGLKEQGKLLKVVKTEKPKEVNKKENNILIKKETQKAYLLNKDGVDFWVQKRWYKDGKLTPAGEKALEDKKEFSNTKKSMENKYIKFKSKPVWESEKAVAFDLNIDLYDLEEDRRVRVFIPKSQIKDNSIPFWLYKAKIEEALDKFYGMGLGGFTIDDDAFDYSDFSDSEKDYLKKLYGNNLISYISEINNSKNAIYTILDDELYEIIDDTAKDHEEFTIENCVENALEDLITNYEPTKEDKGVLQMALIEELKKLITKVENEKSDEDKGEKMDEKDEKKVENNEPDYKKLYEELKAKLEAKKEEKVENEANDKKEEKEEDKKDEKEVENKCKNSVDNSKEDHFEKMNEVYNAAHEAKEENIYVSREEQIQAANEYFGK